MSKLTTVAADDLTDAFESSSTGKTPKRSIIGLAYNDDVSVETLSERYDIPRSTVYSWFDRQHSRPKSETNSTPI